MNTNRDAAVRLLQNAFCKAMGQDSLDNLGPEFQAQIAEVIDQTIAAAVSDDEDDHAAALAGDPTQPAISPISGDSPIYSEPNVPPNIQAGGSSLSKSRKRERRD